MADLRPGDPFHEHLAGERGIDGVGPESTGQFVLVIGENGAGPTAHVVEFDAPPVIERERVTRVPLWLVVRPENDEPAGHAHV